MAICAYIHGVQNPHRRHSSLGGKALSPLNGRWLKRALGAAQKWDRSNWSSYPSHRHDEDDFPRITYLEETYYHRLNPASGFGIQRVYTDDGSLDETMAVHDGEVVLVPRGHHPCGAPYGFEMYYLNVMAGPRRNWRFVPAQEVEWIMERDA